MIRYEIAKDVRGEKQEVRLAAYNTLGQEVTVLVNREQSAGSYEVKFSVKSLPSGIYHYQIKAGKYTEIKKMILIG